MDIYTLNKAQKKSKRKQLNYSSAENERPTTPDLYYSTLPPNVSHLLPTTVSPYATFPIAPAFMNQTCPWPMPMPNMPMAYYNCPPPTLSYGLGDVAGPPKYTANPMAGQEEKAKEFEILLKGFILFVMMNSLVSN